MKKKDFEKSLSKEMECVYCKVKSPIKLWLFVPFGSAFIAVHALECVCGKRDVFAVGSSVEAHQAALALRMRTLVDSGIPIPEAQS
ncbi:hypothetical protein INH39_08475 [Massilia violaceinigra]|uniref:Uncharacterized protein n=1 Tax=Massilia violaceinigra TaxID=2045208 RepID=A0ABY4ABF3_9BURK|nr:hypothetical protein [Massilia violaceinigra]UOD31702.1 hypothetical protein INH39_08475 [Massilia violaceinigra]